MKTFLRWLPGILFNVAEFAIIWLLGVWIGICHEHVLLILMAFILMRMTIGKPMHYKMWQKCLIASLLIFLSLFIVAKAHFLIALIMAIFTALILSKHADVRDMFMWKPRSESRFRAEMDYVQAHELYPAFIEFENRLESDKDQIAFTVYKQIFKQNLSWEQVADNLSIDTQRLTPIVERIAFSLRLHFDI